MKPKEQHVTVSHPGYSDEFYSEESAVVTSDGNAAGQELSKSHDTTLAANLEAVRMLGLKLHRSEVGECGRENHRRDFNRSCFLRAKSGHNGGYAHCEIF